MDDEDLGEFGDEEFDDDDLDDDDLDDDDDEDGDRPRLGTFTKVVIVAAVWVLFTLFLIGQFNKNKTIDPVAARLDTDNSVDDGGTPGVVDTPDEEAADTNGDGLIDDTERAALVETAAAMATAEGGSGAAGTGSGSGGSSGVYEGSAAATPGSAVPGAAPNTGGSSGATSTAAPSTTKPASGSTTTTTIKSGGGGATTTTPQATTTPPTTSGSGGSGTPVTVSVTAKNEAYSYPDGRNKDLVVPRNSKIKFENKETSANIDHSFTIAGGVWNSDEINKNSGSRTMETGLTAGSYSYACSVHSDTMKGTINVT